MKRWSRETVSIQPFGCSVYDFCRKKHGVTEDHLINMSNIKGPTFMRLRIGFMKKIIEYCINSYAIRFRNMFDMEPHVDQYACLNNFPYALEAVEIII